MNCSNSSYAQGTKSDFQPNQILYRKPHYNEVFAKCRFAASELLIAATLAKEMESVCGIFYFSTLLQSQQLIMCCHARKAN